MKVISTNVGARERLTGSDFDKSTGIFKRAVEGRVVVGDLGLESDAIVNTRHHGGPDQAVYLYRSEDYDWWSGALDVPVPIGSFGENLTLEGLPSPEAAIGTRLTFDEVELEVTAPRIPCRTLETRMGIPGFIKQFIRAQRSGFYCRVIRTGTIAAGETFETTRLAGDAISTNDIFRASYRKLSADELRGFLVAPIDLRTRAEFERQLAKREAE